MGMEIKSWQESQSATLQNFFSSSSFKAERSHSRKRSGTRVEGGAQQGDLPRQDLPRFAYPITRDFYPFKTIYIRLERGKNWCRFPRRNKRNKFSTEEETRMGVDA